MGTGTRLAWRFVGNRGVSRAGSRAPFSSGPIQPFSAQTSKAKRFEGGGFHHGQEAWGQAAKEGGEAEGEACAEAFELSQRTSTDPTIRLQKAEKWPVVRALVGTELWNDGIGYLVLARQEPKGDLICASYLVDVYCLGVKNTFWHAGTLGDFKDLIERMEETISLVPISPACLVKIIQGAVEYAGTFGFRPHRDFRHTALLLAGIDPSTLAEEFTFGRDGKPYYVQGPYESPRRPGRSSNESGRREDTSWSPCPPRMRTI